MTLAELRANPISFPGGYSHRAMTDDGAVLCSVCVMDDDEIHEGGDRDGFRYEGAFIYWEGPDLVCPGCNALIPSEYGDPNEGEEK